MRRDEKRRAQLRHEREERTRKQNRKTTDEKNTIDIKQKERRAEKKSTDKRR